MKLLRLIVDGVSLFKESLDISFYGVQRVYEFDERQMFHLFSNVYLNCANAVIGKNASGKTTVLHTINFALHLLNNDSLNHIASNYVLVNSESVRFTMFFYDDNESIFCLQTKLKPDTNTNGLLKILSETLYMRRLTTTIARKDLFNLNEYDLVQERDKNEIYLPDDVSIVIGLNKKFNYRMYISSLWSYTDVNQLKISDDSCLAIAKFLDASIENLYMETKDNSSLIHLKFKTSDEIILNSIAKLEQYLSSGTIKGIMIFSIAKECLIKGGYLLIDELENHFNKEIVSTLIRMFSDATFNTHGGSLIFTTHYSELLDIFERNDCINITENQNGISIKNLSTILKRKDIKKSEIYDSSFIADTAPSYDDYIELKKNFASYIK